MILWLLLALSFPGAVPAQSPSPQAPSLEQIRQLFDASRYREIIALAPASPANSPELNLYRGLALARLERWSEAKAALEAGYLKQPRNERFLVELAGVAYKLKDFRSAKANLRQALRLAPHDDYARNFLATLYFLDGNLEAALDNWNRIGKPKITAVTEEPQPRVNDALIERSFAFSPLEMLRLGDLRTTNARLDNLQIFARYRFELRPAGSDAYTLAFRSVERDRWGAGKLDGLLSLFRGLPYLTVHSEFYNVNHSATNVISLFRWDDNKRRAFASVSTPLGNDPRRRVAFRVDARDENWDLSSTFRGAAAPLSDLNLEKIEAGPELRSVEGAGWGWQAGVVYAYRRFRNVTGVSPAGDRFFTGGGSLEYRAGLHYRILDDPERRLTIDSSASGAFGRNFARDLGSFGKIEGSATLHWFPRDRGDDYETTAQFRAGRGLGLTTIDQLYQLGIERDNDLWLRGIAGTRDGRKGSAPLGREFALWNWETDKTVYRTDLLDIKVGPLFDIGRIVDPSGLFGSSGWLWDPGVACTIRVLGSVSLTLSYGRDIGSGTGTFYASSSR